MVRHGVDIEQLDSLQLGSRYTASVSLRDEAEAVASAASDLETFFGAVKETRIPYLACSPSVEPGRLLIDTIDAFYIMGRASLPMTVGLTMHQYIVNAFGTMPIDIPALRPLLYRIEQERKLVAIGSFGDNIRAKGKAPDTIVIENERLIGKTHFTSMASQADLMTVVATRGDVLGFYIVELDDATLGDPVFEGAPMAGADTRTVEIDVALKPENIITEDPVATEAALFYCTAWFEALVSAAYLGAASRAIDEARSFARGVSLSDGTRLSEVDGALLEIGRMVIRLKAALQIARSVAPALQGFGHVPLVDAINHLAEVAAIAKHHCTQAAEEIVQTARRFVGTRAMRPGNIIADLTGQVVFGPLHPKVAAIFERGAGEEVLAMDTFLGLD